MHKDFLGFAKKVQELERGDSVLHSNGVSSVVKVNFFEQIILRVSATPAVLRVLVEIEGIICHLCEHAIPNKLSSQTFVKWIQKPLPVVRALNLSPPVTNLEIIWSQKRSIMCSL